MHYNGPIVRPQTDAYSIFLEVTVGCTHSHCKFCNFYQGYPFQVASFEQIEEDLQEAAAYAPHAKHVWASGGNPFALGVEHLAKNGLRHPIAPYSLTTDMMDGLPESYAGY